MFPQGTHHQLSRVNWTKINTENEAKRFPIIIAAVPEEVFEFSFSSFANPFCELSSFCTKRVTRFSHFVIRSGRICIESGHSLVPPAPDTDNSSP